MRISDIFKFKLFDRQDKADLEVVNENFLTAEAEIDKKADKAAVETKITEIESDLGSVQSAITKKLDKTNVSNASNVTQAGYALDARQANPEIDGSLAGQILTQNISLTNTSMNEEFYNVRVKRGGQLIWRTFINLFIYLKNNTQLAIRREKIKE